MTMRFRDLSEVGRRGLVKVLIFGGGLLYDPAIQAGECVVGVCALSVGAVGAAG
jgi:hypothetical protein